MDFDFKDIGLLKEMFKDIKVLLQASENKVEKRWLSTRELATYLDYSIDRIHKLKGVSFLEGIHYHKSAGKLLFDKVKIDNWVMGFDTSSNEAVVDVHETVNNLLENLLVS